MLNECMSSFVDTCFRCVILSLLCPCTKRQASICGVLSFAVWELGACGRTSLCGRNVAIKCHLTVSVCSQSVCYAAGRFKRRFPAGCRNKYGARLRPPKRLRGTVKWFHCDACGSCSRRAPLSVTYDALVVQLFGSFAGRVTEKLMW